VTQTSERYEAVPHADREWTRADIWWWWWWWWLTTFVTTRWSQRRWCVTQR